MSRRRCCCGGTFPSCERCFSIAFTANYVESADTVTSYVTCALECDLGTGVGYQETQTKTWHSALRRIRSHEYLLASDGVSPCFCRRPCKTKTWEPPASTFECQLTWCTTGSSNLCNANGAAFVGCTAPAPRAKTQTNFVGGNCIQCTPTTTGFRLQFTGTLSDITLSDAGCDYSVLVGSGLGTWNATSIILDYCCRQGTNCCVLDLVRVEVVPADGLGGGTFATADCECTPGTGGVTFVTVGTAPTAVETSATGFGPVWAIAGAPPLSLTCTCC